MTDSRVVEIAATTYIYLTVSYCIVVILRDRYRIAYFCWVTVELGAVDAVREEIVALVCAGL